MSMWLWLGIGIVLVIIIWAISIYNRLVSLRIRSEEAWSDIDVQLKRRYNLIPNLVEAVKGYAQHEKTVFENVTKARTAAINAAGVEAQSKAENMLSDALKSLFAVAENYPNLKASDNFAKLQDELTDTENKIEAARRFYNSNVRDLNIKIDRFPDKMIAGSFSFKKKDMFELDLEEERKAVTVKF